eukprot:TRINITY_DN1603_c0_g1_i1.p1 TRINITY_DN1603_c0_g1~~TRINITY_DN1603_c0_g1_i1.p1  ORF type:complete len:1140 (+),score=250.46 TRINITY_DN1603_c0_g1_i1:279-3698(+)
MVSNKKDTIHTMSTSGIPDAYRQRPVPILPGGRPPNRSNNGGTTVSPSPPGPPVAARSRPPLSRRNTEPPKQILRRRPCPPPRTPSSQAVQPLIRVTTHADPVLQHADNSPDGIDSSSNGSSKGSSSVSSNRNGTPTPPSSAPHRRLPPSGPAPASPREGSRLSSRPITPRRAPASPPSSPREGSGSTRPVAPTRHGRPPISPPSPVPSASSPSKLPSFPPPTPSTGALSPLLTPSDEMLPTKILSSPSLSMNPPSSSPGEDGLQMRSSDSSPFPGINFHHEGSKSSPVTMACSLGLSGDGTGEKDVPPPLPPAKQASFVLSSESSSPSRPRSHSMDTRSDELTFQRAPSDQSLDIGSPSLVAVPEEAEKERDPATEREQVEREIIETETIYVGDMNFLFNEYLLPMRETKCIDAEELNLIFANLEMILAVHEKLAISLADEDTVMAEAFLELVGYFKVYAEYCNNQQRAFALVAKRMKSNNDFATICDAAKKHPDSRSLDLVDFLIKPTQRICKYPLLFKSLLDCTPEDSDTRDPLQKVFESLQSCAAHVNEKKRDAENMERVVEIQKSIEGLERFKIVTSSRRIVLEGDCKMFSEFVDVEGAGRPTARMDVGGLQLPTASLSDDTHCVGGAVARHVFVFNDLIVFCKEQKMLRQAPYKFKALTRIHGNIQVKELASTDNVGASGHTHAFKIVDPISRERHKCIVMVFLDVESKSEYHRAVAHQIVAAQDSGIVEELSPKVDEETKGSIASRVRSLSDCGNLKKIESNMSSSHQRSSLPGGGGPPRLASSSPRPTKRKKEKKEKKKEDRHTLKMGKKGSFVANQKSTKNLIAELKVKADQSQLKQTPGAVQPTGSRISRSASPMLRSSGGSVSHPILPDRPTPPLAAHASFPNMNTSSGPGTATAPLSSPRSFGGSSGPKAGSPRVFGGESPEVAPPLPACPNSASPNSGASSPVVSGADVPYEDLGGSLPRPSEELERQGVRLSRFPSARLSQSPFKKTVLPQRPLSARMSPFNGSKTSQRSSPNLALPSRQVGSTLSSSSSSDSLLSDTTSADTPPVADKARVIKFLTKRSKELTKRQQQLEKRTAELTERNNSLRDDVEVLGVKYLTLSDDLEKLRTKYGTQLDESLKAMNVKLH